MPKNHICGCVVFLWKNWWIMKLLFVEFWMDSWLIVDDVLEHVVDELV